MKAIEVARIYVDTIALYDSIPDHESVAKDAVASFRANVHQALMDALRVEGIEFEDRFEATRIAFEMVDLERLEPHSLINPKDRPSYRAIKIFNRQSRWLLPRSQKQRRRSPNVSAYPSMLLTSKKKKTNR
jgi:hypothetical protein